MSHLEERLQADLELIRVAIWNLGDAVERAVRDARQVLSTGDADLAFATVLGDHPINRASRRCDHLCHTFIARHLPSAGHLRTISATIRVNVALERIGDYAVTISREALQLGESLPDTLQVELEQLSDECLEILHQSREAFRDGNADSAIALMSQARRVEVRTDGVYDQLFSGAQPLTAGSQLALFAIFNMFKRVADQAKNVCDYTVYAVRGVAKIPKAYRILFMDQAGSDLGLLAAVVGRKRFPTAAGFDVAMPGPSVAPTGTLREFIERIDLDVSDIRSRSLAAMTHDFSDYHVLVSVQGSWRQYLPRVPFHTSALDWPLAALPAGTPSPAAYEQAYRELVSRIDALIDLLAGDEAA